jgi:superfamily II DNA helicase RecQ
VLALTATATAPTRECICRLLGVPPSGVLMDAPMRENLRLRVERVDGGGRGGEIAARIVNMVTRGEEGGRPWRRGALFRRFAGNGSRRRRGTAR